MKKLIAIVATATAVVAGCLSACAQDWTDFVTTGPDLAYDSNLGGPAGNGDLNVEILWALTGTADTLGPGCPTTGTTRTVGSVQATIASMLANGWLPAQNYNSGNGTAALGTVETVTGITVPKAGNILPYNGGDPFEISPASSGASGSTIEMVLISFSGSAANYSAATVIGWSGMINEPIGLSAGDPNATITENSAGLTPFGTTTIPEPTTLALVGLGGLSMIFVRRRKA